MSIMLSTPNLDRILVSYFRFRPFFNDTAPFCNKVDDRILRVEAKLRLRVTQTAILQQIEQNNLKWTLFLFNSLVEALRIGMGMVNRSLIEEKAKLGIN